MSAIAAEIKAAVEEATAPMLRQMDEMRDLLKQSIEGNQEPFVTVAEAANILNCSEKTIRRKFVQGQCEIKRVGRKILIPREVIFSVQP